VDPGNTDGIPKVLPHRALPVRDKPLPGTKSMQAPHDGSLEEMIHRKTEHAEYPSRTAQVMGYMAVTSVVVFWCLLWYVWRTPDVHWMTSRGGLFAWLMMLVLGCTHVSALFSQILSNGRNRMGSMSLLGLYVGTIMLAVVDHLLR
jgi:hypothetical protein